MNLTFTSLTPKARRQAKRNAGLANQSTIRGKNKLTAMREAATEKPEPPKAYEECQCKPFIAGGKQYMLGQSDCPRHGIFNIENPAFTQHPERAPSHTKRRKATGDGNGE